MDPSGRRPSASHSSALGDLAGAREAAATAAEVSGPLPDRPEPVPEPDWFEAPPVLAVAVAAGLVVSVIGLAAVARLPALGGLVVVCGLGLAGVSAYTLVPRVGALGRLGLAAVAGLVALVAGALLGSWSYDQRFIYDDTGTFWEVLGWVGPLLGLLGLLVTLGSLAGVVLVLVVRSFRRATGR